MGHLTVFNVLICCPLLKSQMLKSALSDANNCIFTILIAYQMCQSKVWLILKVFMFLWKDGLPFFNSGIFKMHGIFQRKRVGHLKEFRRKIAFEI